MTGLGILVVTPSLPYPADEGFAIRVRELARRLAGRHDVHLLAYAGPAGTSRAVTALEAEGIHVHVVRRPQDQGRATKTRSMFSTRSHFGSGEASRPMDHALRELLRRRSFDIVQIETPQIGARAREIAARGADVVLDAHNIWAELLRRTAVLEPSRPRRLFQMLEAAKVEREERAWWRRVNGCVVPSDRDAAIVQRAAPATPTAVVPNGVDIEAFVPQPASTNGDDELVFTGLISYRPNADAVRFFVDEVLPLVRRRRPDARLTVVGKQVPRKLAALAGPAVRFTGRVPDIRPYLAAASVVIVPLRSGSGTRLKILEALAMARPVVSTSIGAEGLELTPGRDIVIADAPADFAEAIVRLLEDRVAAADLGHAGRAVAEERYSWASAARRLEGFYGRLRGSATTPSGALDTADRAGPVDTAGTADGAGTMDASDMRGASSANRVGPAETAGAVNTPGTAGAAA